MTLAYVAFDLCFIKTFSCATESYEILNFEIRDYTFFFNVHVNDMGSKHVDR